MILLLLGVIEAFIVHIISNGELERLGYEKADSEEETPKWMLITFACFLVTYLVLALVHPLASIYVFPFVLLGLVPIIIEFIFMNKRYWIYLIVAIAGVFSLFLLNYVNLLAYPLVLLVTAAPFVIEKIVRILYTIYLKYLNNAKNNIK